jgi:hypothetical protein
MKRSILFVGVWLALGLLIYTASGRNNLRFDSCNITIDISAASAAGVVRVTYIVIGHASLIDAVAASTTDVLSTMKSQTNTNPFEVTVRYRSRRQRFSLYWNDMAEDSHIMVFLHRKNRTRDVHVVPVPDLNVTRRAVVGPQNVIKSGIAE